MSAVTSTWNEPPRGKQPYAQPYKVTLRDGTTFTVCCGPAVARLDGVVAFVPTGVRRDGLDGIVRAEVLRAEREAYEIDDVYRALAPWKFNHDTEVTT